MFRRDYTLHPITKQYHNWSRFVSLAVTCSWATLTMKTKQLRPLMMRVGCTLVTSVVLMR